VSFRSNRVGPQGTAVAFLLALAFLSSSPVFAQDAQALLHKYKCYMCHADKESKTGPAYVDVAARYRGNSEALATLTTAVRRGEYGAGPWHMPPHPEVSDADARKMIRYILSLPQ